MDNFSVPLSVLPIGHTAQVCDLLCDGSERRRMLDLGLVKGTQIEALQKSPCGDPVAYYIRGAVIALRCEDAESVLVSF